MFKYKFKNRKGQVMVEFVLVLGIYLFLMGFMITGFQIMHNKMVFNMAAYDGVRRAVVLNPLTDSYDISGAKSDAKNILEHAIGVDNVEVKIYSHGDYFTSTVSGRVKYLFPIISPDGVGVDRYMNISTSFTMRKEKK